MKYFLVSPGCFPHQEKSFLVYLCLTCLMNIQLLTGLQANIHGKELISNILLPPILFMRYVEVFLVFRIVIFLIFEPVGLLVIIIVPYFQFLFSLFYFYNV